MHSNTVYTAHTLLYVRLCLCTTGLKSGAQAVGWVICRRLSGRA